MDGPITRAMLLQNRKNHIEAQMANFVKHWVHKLSEYVIQASKLQDEPRFLFTDIVETTDMYTFQYAAPLQECFIEIVMCGLRKKFPDADIQYQNRTLTIDWSPKYVEV